MRMAFSGTQILGQKPQVCLHRPGGCKYAGSRSSRASISSELATVWEIGDTTLAFKVRLRAFQDVCQRPALLARRRTTSICQAISAQIVSDAPSRGGNQTSRARGRG